MIAITAARWGVAPRAVEKEEEEDGDVMWWRVVTTVLTSSILSSFDFSITLTATLFLLKTCCGNYEETT